MENNLTQTIWAKKGFVIGALVISLLMIVGFCSYGIILGIQNNQLGDNPIGSMAVLVWAIGASLFALGLITASIQINKTNIKIKSLFGQKEMWLQDVAEIKLIPLYGDTFILGFNVVLLDKNRRDISLFASYYSNRHDLLKAVIERARHLNARVIIDKSLTDAYGYPPYGIFEPKERA